MTEQHFPAGVYAQQPDALARAVYDRAVELGDRDACDLAQAIGQLVRAIQVLESSSQTGGLLSGEASPCRGQ
jgi:hypothetical protein